MHRLCTTPSPHSWLHLLLALALPAFLSACQSTPPGPASPTAKPGVPPRISFSKTGIASYYSNRLHGGPTASGKRYNRWAMTAAQNALPLGSWVRVTHLKNGRTVDVLVNDRMGHKKRIIDLSYAAAYRLGMTKQGLAKVRVDVISVPPARKKR